MNDDFLLYKKVKNFSFEMMRYTNNIPKSLSYLRVNILTVFDNAIRLIRYYVVNNKESQRVKLKYLKDLVVELSMVDYYLECLYTFGVLGKVKFNVMATELENIRKLAFGVIRNEKISS